MFIAGLGGIAVLFGLRQCAASLPTLSRLACASREAARSCAVGCVSCGRMQGGSKPMKPPVFALVFIDKVAFHGDPPVSTN